MLNLFDKLPYVPINDPNCDLESKEILKAIIEATQFLSSLNGRNKHQKDARTAANLMLINECNLSSHVENHGTTQEESFLADLTPKISVSATKNEAEKNKTSVQNCIKMMKYGSKKLRDTGYLTHKLIIGLYETLHGHKASAYRDVDVRVGNFSPPSHQDVSMMMSQLEKFINDYEGSYSDVDMKRAEILKTLHPFIKMSLIHYMFETIHPFRDGNGRIGRVLNILYLIKEGTIDRPLLYLSGYLLRNRTKYIDFLSNLNEGQNRWHEWILFIIKGIKETSQTATKFIDRFIFLKNKNFINLSNNYLSETLGIKINKKTERINRKKELNPKKEHEFDKVKRLFHHIYSRPYTDTNRIMDTLNVSRNTALKYVGYLQNWGHLTIMKIGNKNIYKNDALVALLASSLTNAEPSQELQKR